MKRKIICIHGNNGFTGSPNVLATVVEGLHKENYDVTLVSSFNNDGFLSSTNCTFKKKITYVFKKNKFSRLFQFIKFQFFSGIFILGTDKKDVIYLNTVQPFFPAIIARLRGMRVIYHFHESYPEKSLFIKFLYYIVEKTANEIICVSQFVLNQLNENSQKKAVFIHNSLSSYFLENKIKTDQIRVRKKILMVSSAREYKGIFEFCKLAKILNEYDFTLVCDATKKEVKELFKDFLSISNLEIVETQKIVHDFYAQSDLIVNFSIPTQMIETFGLTILEGMHYGLPCIVPPIGGITELVHEGVNGFKVDIRQKEDLILKIRLILDDERKYHEMSNAAMKISKNFTFDVFIDKIKLMIN
jgi:glycosyltransferase involved in cell wall biosynthesis